VGVENENVVSGKRLGKLGRGVGIGVPFGPKTRDFLLFITWYPMFGPAMYSTVLFTPLSSRYE